MAISNTILIVLAVLAGVMLFAGVIVFMYMDTRHTQPSPEAITQHSFVQPKRSPKVSEATDVLPQPSPKEAPFSFENYPNLFGESPRASSPKPQKRVMFGSRRR